MASVATATAATASAVCQRRRSRRTRRSDEADVSGTTRSAAANSPAVAKRSPGNVASAVSMASSISSGISGRAPVTDGGRSARPAPSTPVGVRPANGVCPSSIS